MALINNLYVQVINEDWDKSVDSTSHPVEKGFEVTDSVRKKPKTLSLSGNIVSAGNMTAEAICSKLHEMATAGSLIKFVGRKSASNMQIQSFNESYSNEIWGGFAFSMQLKEVRIAQIAYVEPKASVANVSSTGEIKVGDIVVFKGGNVYISSDAPKAATTKGRQTCKVTQINERSWSLHDYHLISTEKVYPHNVYGWCNIEDIEGGTAGGNTAAKTNVSPLKTSRTRANGLQQVIKSDPVVDEQNVSSEKVYHKIKSGDTLNSIYEAYKDLRVGYKSNSLYITKAWLIETNFEEVKVRQETTATVWQFPPTGTRIFVGYRRTSGVTRSTGILKATQK